MAYDQMDPVGDFREDMNTAKLSSIIVNLFKMRFGKKSAKMTKPIDFMPDWDGQLKQETKTQSMDEIKGQISTIASMFGKKEK